MQQINIITSTGIIFRESNPSEIFAEIKDEGYPNPVFRNHIFPIGGAKEVGDLGPRETLLREITEELAVNDPEDMTTLTAIKQVMAERAQPYKDYLYIIPKEIFDRLMPEKKKDTWTELASFWMIPLPENTWLDLQRLQTKYKNLSTESNTIMTSLSEMLEKNTKISWEMAVALQQFFIEKGFKEAEGLPTMEGVTMNDLGAPRSEYTSYEGDFEVVAR